MGWFSGIFTSDTIDKSVDAIIDTGDAIWYTEEEKAKALQLSIDTKLKMLPLFEPFKLAQRYIAFAFTYNFIFAFWIAVIIWGLGTKQNLQDYLALISAFELGWIMLAIITWYFGGGFMNSYRKKETTK